MSSISDERKTKRKNLTASERRKHQKAYQTTCVVVKWKTICQNESICQAINQILPLWNKLALEAYQFLNFHILRCLNENLDLPELDQTFTYRCCSAVKQNDNTIDDENIEKSRNIWHEFRKSEIRGNELVNTSGLSQLFTHLPLEMLTACKNHIILNFVNRLLRWMKLNFNFNRKEAWKFIFYCFETPRESRTSIENEFVDYIRYFPSEVNIKSNFNHFVRLDFDFLKDMERRSNEKQPSSKTFSIFPLKNGFGFSHIPLNNTTLHNIMDWWLKKNPSNAFHFRDKHILQGGISKAQFNERKDQYWRALFDIKKYETCNRKFAFHITTNGYSASIHLERLKIIHGEEEQVDSQLQLRNDYQRVIGCDPGAVNLITTMDQNGRSFTYSTRQYRHEAQMDAHRLWFERLKERVPRYGELLKSIPSLHVSDSNEFMRRCISILKNRDELFEFHLRIPFRKWKFKLRIFAEKALVKICKKLKDGLRKDQVVIGMGDWSRRDGIIKGHPNGPVKKLKEKMKVFMDVVDIDEFRTSKKCSKCHSKCRDRYYYKYQVNEETKVEDKVKIKGSRVLRCRNNECRTFWDRDVNSSYNHLELLQCILQNKPRSDYLSRHLKN